MAWKPTSLDWVLSHLNAELERLHPTHRSRFQRLLVEPRRAPVESHPGGSVVVVAEHEGRVLYWSDIEDGWELEHPTDAGGIPERGCNQSELSHIAWQLFGEPTAVREPATRGMWKALFPEVMIALSYSDTFSPSEFSEALARPCPRRHGRQVVRVPRGRHPQPPPELDRSVHLWPSLHVRGRWVVCS